MPYPEAINLPFNGYPIRNLYVPAKPGEFESDEPGYWVIVQDECTVLYHGRGNPCLFDGELPDPMKVSSREMLMGTWRGMPLRLLLIGKEIELPADFVAEPLLSLFFHECISDELLTIAGLAQQVARWEKNSAGCPRCGGDTYRIVGTRGKRCERCAHEHFPNVYPCVVVLVRNGDSLLMVRKPEWPEGYYSLPSGFCDFGECLEECVLREVEEETGIRVKNVRYQGSQSWPFPSQLMTAFTADYDGGEIVVDTGELQDAGWYGSDALPPTFSSKSIAGWLIANSIRGEKAG
jgi:NAD+ diphosphatase